LSLAAPATLDAQRAALAAPPARAQLASNSRDPAHGRVRVRVPPPWGAERLRETDGALVLVATYSVGKERLLVALARRYSLLVCVPEARLRGLAMLGLAEEDLRFFTTDPSLACVHVVHMRTFGSVHPSFRADFAAMEAELQRLSRARARPFTRVVGILPTGFALRHKGGAVVGGAGGCATIHLIPYSEHSSSAELDEASAQGCARRGPSFLAHQPSP
jgi:hypothetical protein